MEFSTASDPHTDGHGERTIQTLKDMLRVCTLIFLGSWAEKVLLVGFVYNDIYHQSLEMFPSRHCMEEDVGRRSTGIKPGKEGFWDQIKLMQSQGRLRL